MPCASPPPSFDRPFPSGGLPSATNCRPRGLCESGRSWTVASTARIGGVWLSLLVGLVVLGIGSYFGYQQYQSRQEQLGPDDLILSEVTLGAFDHVVVEQGEIESSSNTEVICQIRSRGNTGTSILWVIDEGTRVEKGDKLVELDSAQLEVELKEDRIEVITAEANVATAAALLEQAEIARQEYLEGVFKTEQKAIESEIAIAEQELRKAQLALGSSERLVAKGLVKSLQLEADQFAVANARNQLEAAQGRLRVLQDLTKRKMLVQFDSEIDAAKANLSAAEARLMEEEQELAEIKEQIEMCVMYAPNDGVVVHANRYSSRGGNAEFVVEPGATVRERQAIIRLPDPTRMQVRCKVNESRITLLRRGMPAKIRIDALPDVELRGRVLKVNRYAEPGSWYSSSIKEYATIVEIVDPPEVIRTGMTASVEIFIQQVPDATQIPIQAVYEHGGKVYSLVRQSPLEFETRAIEIGATNDTMARVESGVQPGETVVLNLRDRLSLMDLPEVTVEDNSGMSKYAGREDGRNSEDADRLADGSDADRPRSNEDVNEGSGSDDERPAESNGDVGSRRPGPASEGKSSNASLNSADS